jgi:hypothetical protein
MDCVANVRNAIKSIEIYHMLSRGIESGIAQGSEVGEGHTIKIVT